MSPANWVFMTNNQSRPAGPKSEPALKWNLKLGRFLGIDVYLHFTFLLLLAFLVMLIKLGSLVTFHFGPAIIAFVLCVALSMAASICFDPHSIWEDEGSA